MKMLTEIPLVTAIPSEKLFAFMSDVSFIPSASVAEYLDLEYFTNISGAKQASPIVERLSGQTDWETGEMETKLASIVLNRYKTKWEQLFARYADLNTINLLDNIKSVSELEHGKIVTTSGTDTLTKSGTETHTQNGTETREETYPVDRKTTRTINGGWKDTDTTKVTRTGTQDMTESFPSPRVSSKATTGGYSDTDTIKNTRTGSQKTTDKGGTTTSTFGFNSSNAVPASKVEPTDSSLGVTSEVTYGASGLIDEHSGSITRSYTSLTEATTESGSKKISTTFGENGLIDENSGDVSRLYQNYVDEVKETGSKKLTIGFGQDGKTDTLSYASRSDSRSTSGTSTNSGTDVTSETGYKYNSLVNEYLALFMSAEFLDFLAIVYSDCDEILTCPYYV